jgi:hypothetical protein
METPEAVAVNERSRERKSKPATGPGRVDQGRERVYIENEVLLPLCSHINKK